MGASIWGLVASTATAASTGTQSGDGSSASGKTDSSTGLDKSAFLQLLMTQMQNQDPFNPMDGQDFFAQLAQLTSLEQMWQMNDNMQTMVQQQQLLEAGNLIGRQVEGIDAYGTRQSGTVTGVRVRNNEVSLSLGGVELPLSQVDTVNS